MYRKHISALDQRTNKKHPTQNGDDLVKFVQERDTTDFSIRKEGTKCIYWIGDRKLTFAKEDSAGWSFEKQ